MFVIEKGRRRMNPRRGEREEKPAGVRIGTSD